jgi:hypothetical protein
MGCWWLVLTKSQGWQGLVGFWETQVETFCVFPPVIFVSGSQIWLSLMPLLRLWRSQSPKWVLMVQPCVCACVESDSINALACANLIAGRLGLAAIN